LRCSRTPLDRSPIRISKRPAGAIRRAFFFADFACRESAADQLPDPGMPLPPPSPCVRAILTEIYRCGQIAINEPGYRTFVPVVIFVRASWAGRVQRGKGNPGMFVS
jgi:hypothetical protein